MFTLFGGTAFESPVYQTLFGIPVIAMDYTSTVMPVILIVYFASKVQKLMEKIIPEIVAFFFVPMFTLLISLTAGSRWRKEIWNSFGITPWILFLSLYYNSMCASADPDLNAKIKGNIFDSLENPYLPLC